MCVIVCDWPLLTTLSDWLVRTSLPRFIPVNGVARRPELWQSAMVADGHPDGQFNSVVASQRISDRSWWVFCWWDCRRWRQTFSHRDVTYIFCLLTHHRQSDIDARTHARILSRCSPTDLRHTHIIAMKIFIRYKMVENNRHTQAQHTTWNLTKT